MYLPRQKKLYLASLVGRGVATIESGGVMTPHFKIWPFTFEK